MPIYVDFNQLFNWIKNVKSFAAWWLSGLLMRPEHSETKTKTETRECETEIEIETETKNLLRDRDQKLRDRDQSSQVNCRWK